MTVTADKINIPDSTYTVDVAGKPGHLIVNRRMSLKSGESVTLQVQIPIESNVDLVSINKSSIARANEILQVFLGE